MKLIFISLNFKLNQIFYNIQIRKIIFKITFVHTLYMKIIPKKICFMPDFNLKYNCGFHFLTLNRVKVPYIHFFENRI